MLMPEGETRSEENYIESIFSEELVIYVTHLRGPENPEANEHICTNTATISLM